MIYLNNDILIKCLKKNDVLYCYNDGLKYTVVYILNYDLYLFNEEDYDKSGILKIPSEDYPLKQKYNMAKIEIFNEQEIEERKMIKELRPELFV